MVIVITTEMVIDGWACARPVGPSSGSNIESVTPVRLKSCERWTAAYPLQDHNDEAG